VIDWLRDEQNIFIQIMCKRASNTPWWYVVKRSYKTTFTEVLAQQTYISYKECEEAAILAALELV